MKTYLCDDGNGSIRVDAKSAREAAQLFVDSGEWGEFESTEYIEVYVRLEDAPKADAWAYTIALDPPEPMCAPQSDGGRAHKWESPYSVLGGDKHNPGVQGNGGGVIMRRVCAHCGVYRVVNTWATVRATGEQGVESTTYEGADEQSAAWIAGNVTE